MPSFRLNEIARYKKKFLFILIFVSLNYENLSYTDETEFDELEVGQQSVVYAIVIMNGTQWYLIDFEQLTHPMFYPKAFFKIEDWRISKYWVAKEQQDEYDNNNLVLNFSFPEFLDDEYFYGELLEDNPKQLAIFRKYQTLLRNEFVSKF